MSKGTAIIGMLISLVVGVFAGEYWTKHEGGGGDATPAAALPDNNVERYKIAIGNAPAKGPDHAKVTIIEWSDFQCPFCSRVEPTIDQVMRDYGKDVRVIWNVQEPASARPPVAREVRQGSRPLGRRHQRSAR
jgi:hypothetical protein